MVEVSQDTQVPSLSWEDPLEKEMATYSSILAWRIPWTEEPGGLQSMGSQRIRHDWATETSTFKRRQHDSCCTAFTLMETESLCSTLFRRIKHSYTYCKKLFKKRRDSKQNKREGERKIQKDYLHKNCIQGVNWIQKEGNSIQTQSRREASDLDRCYSTEY